ncbi:CcdC protein domain-containing protein [Paenibacillus allorhizosphaerae]|uniref:DUF1453 family protein n=1 Tax=Paenibacillus allorhizosphaerae TaxID=2849866 RepID=A0ABN7TWR8_9BACL|nr:CcdC protein domain-containing protein [Paenibacillus allorhizosphaerae]CAG7653908.1 hypothetical protein PAECIP111802_05618 [Paenibacillus allorhizosphaerae]
MNATVSLAISILIFFLIIRGQLRGMQKPLKKSGVGLLLPIAYISTSLFQLMDPSLHIREDQVLLSVLIGAVISIPLIWTTNFEVKGTGDAFIKRSKAVFVILIGVFALRFVFVAGFKLIDPGTLGFMCNLVTLSYIALWRIGSFVKFRNALRHPSSAIRA